MLVEFTDQKITHKGSTLVLWDSFDGPIIFWKNVQKTIDDIPLDTIVTVDGGEFTQTDALSWAVKSICLALMFARNYGFMCNIDLEQHKFLWDKFSSLASLVTSTVANQPMFNLEAFVLPGDYGLECTTYEDTMLFNGKILMVAATVDWKAVLKVINLNSLGLSPFTFETLVALALVTAKNEGLNEGKPR